MDIQERVVRIVDLMIAYQTKECSGDISLEERIREEIEEDRREAFKAYATKPRHLRVGDVLICPDDILTATYDDEGGARVFIELGRNEGLHDRVFNAEEMAKIHEYLGVV